MAWRRVLHENSRRIDDDHDDVTQRRNFFFDDQDEPVVEVKEVQHQLVNLNNSFAIRTQ